MVKSNLNPFPSWLIRISFVACCHVYQLEALDHQLFSKHYAKNRDERPLLSCETLQGLESQTTEILLDSAKRDLGEHLSICPTELWYGYQA